MDVDILADYAMTATLRECGMHSSKERQWSEAETRFLVDNLAILPREIIAEELGRSVNAIKIRQVRHGIPSPSKRPGYLTGHDVAKILRVDIHAIMTWHARGILRFDIIPGERGIMNLPKRRVYQFAVQPKNWIYFKPHRVRDARLRRMIELAMQRWNDEWLTIGQAAAFWGVSDRALNARIRAGSLPAIRWGNWWIRKSDLLQVRIVKGKGGWREKMEEVYYSARADAWILRARDELGLTWQEVAARMGNPQWDKKSVRYRYTVLKGRVNNASAGGTDEQI